MSKFIGGADMKKIVLVVLFLVLVSLVLSKCESCPESLTFYDVSNSYLRRYGEPSDRSSYRSTGYRSRTWTWWEQKLMVTFVDTEYDRYCGWTVESIYRW